MGETGVNAVGAKRERLLTLSFQDADIQHLVEGRMAADESLTRAAAIRAVFLELKEAKDEAEKQAEHIRAQLLAENANTADLNGVIARMENELSQTEAAYKTWREASDRHMVNSIFHGLTEDAETYMKSFFDELVGEGHYVSPQMFLLDLLRRVQEGAKTFIPGNKQIVKKEWIRH